MTSNSKVITYVMTYLIFNNNLKLTSYKKNIKNLQSFRKKNPFLFPSQININLYLFIYL